MAKGIGFGNYKRSNVALVAIMAEMFIGGVSTAKTRCKY